MSFTLIQPPLVRASIGRIRVTSAISPGEPGYIRSMRLQMDQVAKIIDQATKNIKGATAAGIAYALEPIMKASQEIVPIDTEKLKNSGFIEVRHSVNGPVAVIGYARYGQPHYAAFVHEMLQIPHQKGKSAKYLERPMYEGIPLFKRRLINYITKNSGLGK